MAHLAHGPSHLEEELDGEDHQENVVTRGEQTHPVLLAPRLGVVQGQEGRGKEDHREDHIVEPGVLHEVVHCTPGGADQIILSAVPAQLPFWLGYGRLGRGT